VADFVRPGLTAALLCNLPRLLRRPQSFIGAGLVLLVAPWVDRHGAQASRLDQPVRRPLSVAAIQGNVEQSMKWDPAQLNAQLALYRDMSFSSKRSTC
jgi:apolipoprotein N-acyltransferase